MATILGYLSTFATKVFDIGGQLITFVTAEGHELVLLGVVMMLTVTAIGIIRRLIKGV